MSAPSPVRPGATLREVAPGVWLEGGGAAGGILHGPPATLATVCARFGFRNACRDGRVYLTGPKVARLGEVLGALGLPVGLPLGS